VVVLYFGIYCDIVVLCGNLVFSNQRNRTRIFCRLSGEFLKLEEEKGVWIGARVIWGKSGMPTGERERERNKLTGNIGQINGHGSLLSTNAIRNSGKLFNEFHRRFRSFVHQFLCPLLTLSSATRSIWCSTVYASFYIKNFSQNNLILNFYKDFAFNRRFNRFRRMWYDL